MTWLKVLLLKLIFKLVLYYIIDHSSNSCKVQVVLENTFKRIYFFRSRQIHSHTFMPIYWFVQIIENLLLRTFLISSLWRWWLNRYFRNIWSTGELLISISFSEVKIFSMFVCKPLRRKCCTKNNWNSGNNTAMKHLRIIYYI